MSLLDDIEAAVPHRGPGCSVRLILATLTPEDALGLRTAIANRAIYGSTIAAVLRAKGHHMSTETINRHRSGRCSCP